MGGGFPADRVLESVAAFCRDRRVEARIRLRTVGNLAEAVRIIELKGPDQRWRTIHSGGNPDDVPDKVEPVLLNDVDRQILQTAIRAHTRGRRRHRYAPRPWYLSRSVVSATHWGRMSITLRTAREYGLGWLLPTNGELLLVPWPDVRLAEGTSSVLHDDTNRRAVEGPDGEGYYFLHGTEFAPPLYQRVVEGRLTLSEVANLADADQRSIALRYLTFERLISGSGVTLLGRGVKGTALYRLSLPYSIARGRPRGY